MMIGEGAEARIYLERMFGTEVIVKLRCRKAYRIREMDETMRRRRTRKEAGIMLAAAKAGVPVPEIIAVGTFSMYMEKLDGTLLKDTRITSRHMASAGSALALLHSSNMVHGDYTPANIMSTKQGIRIIDFGLADTTMDVEQKAVDLLLMKRAVSRTTYASFESAYAKKSRNAGDVLRQLAELERRGRYQTRTMMG